jgi:hypothetical protein
MREIALHLLDIAENSAAAESRNISIEVHEDLHSDRLSTCVVDDGRGMDAETVQRVQDPFYTTRTTRNVGLGIPLLKLAAEMAAGSFRLGDLASTFLSALISHPNIHWTFVYRITDKDGNSRDFIFDDAELKTELGDISLTEPEVLTFVRGMIEEGIEALAPQTVS